MSPRQPRSPKEHDDVVTKRLTVGLLGSVAVLGMGLMGWLAARGQPSPTELGVAIGAAVSALAYQLGALRR
jgi:hypothetical protein